MGDSNMAANAGEDLVAGPEIISKEDHVPFTEECLVPGNLFCCWLAAWSDDQERGVTGMPGQGPGIKNIDGVVAVKVREERGRSIPSGIVPGKLHVVGRQVQEEYNQGCNENRPGNP